MRRFTQSNPCPYADLVRENLDHLWEGPGRNDFAAALIYSVQKYLGKRSLPREKGDAINAIRNKVLQEDWGWLEQRWDERHRPEATRTAVGSDALPEVLDESAVPAFGTPAYYEWLEQRKGGGD